MSDATAFSNIPYYHLRRVDATRSPVCGLAMLNPGWQHMQRCLETESVLLIGKRGSAKIEDNGIPFEISEGSMLLLPAGHIHRGLIPADKPLSYWWFHFYQCVELDDELRIFLPHKLSWEEASTSLSDQSARTELLKTGIILPQTMKLSKPELIGNLCGEALQNFASGNSPMAYHNSLQKLLLELGREGEATIQEQKEERGASHVLVKQVLELLERELSNPNASVKFFADLLHVNPDYLGRCFKEEQKIPVGQYINRRRVELACLRLRESNSNMEEVARECGFGSRRQFFDEFKKRIGKTPAQYRGESAYVGINAL